MKPHDGLSAEAVVARDMSEPRGFPSLDSCQERSLWMLKEVSLAPHPVVVLQVPDGETFLQELGFESLDRFLRVSNQGPCLTVMEEGGSDQRLVQLDLVREADGVFPRSCEERTRLVTK